MGGEAERLTTTAQGVDDFVWSPDGARLALVLRDASEEDLEAANHNDKDLEGEKKESKPKARKPWVIDRRQLKRDETGYLDRRRTHRYVLDLGRQTWAHGARDAS